MLKHGTLFATGLMRVSLISILSRHLIKNPALSVLSKSGRATSRADCIARVSMLGTKPILAGSVEVGR